MGVVTEATDEMEPMLKESLVERASGEECIGNNEMRQFQQFPAIALDDGNVMVCQRHVTLLHLKVAWCLMGTEHHAVVAVNVYQPQSHNFQSVLNGTCTSRPETTNMRSLLALLADVARINGYGLATVAAEVAQGETDVEAKPVQALRAQASEVLAVALFAVSAVLAQLGEIYPSWYNYV